MNKRKFRKLIEKNINIPNNFNNINKKIDYSKYDNHSIKENKFTAIFTNKKIIISFSVVLVLIIFIPLFTNINLNNFSVSSSMENNTSSKYENSLIQNSSVNNSFIEVNTSNTLISSSCETSQNPDIGSSSSVNTEYKLSELIAGEIVLFDKDKKFYNEESDVYFNLSNAKLYNYKLVNNELVYELGSYIAGEDLPLNTKCHAYIVLEVYDSNSIYDVYDVYEIVI